MIKTPAWLLPYAENQAIAVGLHFTVALLWQAPIWRLPTQPPLAWSKFQDGLLPLFDLAVLLHEPANTHSDDTLVLQHFDAEQRLHRVALRLHHKPELIYVSDDQQCELPDDERWSAIALTCVAHPLGIFPIVDPSRLFDNRLIQAGSSNRSAQTI